MKKEYIIIGSLIIVVAVLSAFIFYYIPTGNFSLGESSNNSNATQETQSEKQVQSNVENITKEIENISKSLEDLEKGLE